MDRKLNHIEEIGKLISNYDLTYLESKILDKINEIIEKQNELIKFHNSISLQHKG